MIQWTLLSATIADSLASVTSTAAVIVVVVVVVVVVAWPSRVCIRTARVRHEAGTEKIERNVCLE